MESKDNLNTTTNNDGSFYYLYDLCYNLQNPVNVNAFLSAYTLTIANLLLNNRVIEQKKKTI